MSHTTARKWLTVLEASYIVFQLPPYHANIRKRLIKSPKLYFYDVGLASYLIGIEHADQIVTHPLRGALFENLVVAGAEEPVQPRPSPICPSSATPAANATSSTRPPTASAPSKSSPGHSSQRLLRP